MYFCLCVLCICIFNEFTLHPKAGLYINYKLQNRIYLLTWYVLTMLFNIKIVLLIKNNKGILDLV